MGKKIIDLGRCRRDYADYVATLYSFDKDIIVVHQAEGKMREAISKR